MEAAPLLLNSGGGESDEKMIFKNSDKFIKFALGENVKQSNWGSYSRFPQTRMGVEQVFVDYFNRALEYGEKWKKYNSLSKKRRHLKKSLGKILKWMFY